MTTKFLVCDQKIRDARNPFYVYYYERPYHIVQKYCVLGKEQYILPGQNRGQRPVPFHVGNIIILPVHLQDFLIKSGWRNAYKRLKIKVVNKWKLPFMEGNGQKNLLATVVKMVFYS